MNLEKYTEVAEILKILAHPVRLCIVDGLIRKGECNVNHMCTNLAIPQSTVSQHLQKLKSANIIVGKRVGVEVYYSVSNQKIASFVEFLFKESI